jgi:hypothetical protein
MQRGTLEIKLKGREDSRCVISRFRPEVDENCALLGYYVASSGNSIPTFRGQPISPIFKCQEFKKKEMLPMGCLETPARNYLYSPRNSPEERSS